MPAPKPRSGLQAPYDFDRQNNHGMELTYFKSFQHFEPNLRGDIIAHADRKPGPDFRVRAGNKIVGVEVTTLCTPLASRAIESTEDRILDEACSMAEGQGLPPACVTLFFNLHKPLRVADRIRIADAVVKVVAENMPPEGDLADLEMRPGQPSEVDLIQVNRRYPRELGRWRAGSEFRAIERNVSGIVQEAITEKASRLSTYVTTCDECWLLLVADSFRGSGNLSLVESGQKQAFSSGFARTYLLDFGRGYLYQLDNTGRFVNSEASA